MSQPQPQVTGAIENIACPELVLDAVRVADAQPARGVQRRRRAEELELPADRVNAKDPRLARDRTLELHAALHGDALAIRVPHEAGRGWMVYP